MIHRSHTFDVGELGTPDMGDPRAVGTTGDLTGSPKEAPMSVDDTHRPHPYRKGLI